MTQENINKLKCELYKLYEETGDAHTLVNECTRLGMLIERTKESDEEVTIDDVFNEFDMKK